MAGAPPDLNLSRVICSVVMLSERRLRGGRRPWQPFNVNQDAALSWERDSYEIKIVVEAGLALPLLTSGIPGCSRNEFFMLLFPRPIANCRETFLGSSAAVQQDSEGAPVLISNATEVETRLDASESTSSVEPQ